MGSQIILLGSRKIMIPENALNFLHLLVHDSLIKEYIFIYLIFALQMFLLKIYFGYKKTRQGFPPMQNHTKDHARNLY